MNAKEYLELTSDLIPEIKRQAAEYYKHVKSVFGIDKVPLNSFVDIPEIIFRNSCSLMVQC